LILGAIIAVTTLSCAKPEAAPGKKLYYAALMSEIHTSSPFRTQLEDFYRVEPDAEEPSPFGEIVERVAAERGWLFDRGLEATSTPSGPVVRSAYEQLKAEILDGLRAAMPVDAVVLGLHGAFVAEGVDDGEGDLLAAVREIVGPDVPVGAGFDAHAHLSDLMVESADIMVFFKEWPHIDWEQTMETATGLTIDTAEGLITPHMAVFDLRMIDSYHTLNEPVKSVVDDMKAAEQRDGVLQVNFVHGFPYADVPDLGTKMLVITDDNAALGAELAEEFGMRIYELRGKTMAEYLSVEEIVSAIKASDRAPIVVADTGDVTGGGAPGDATYILQAFLENGIEGAAFAYIWDPEAAAAAIEAGEGARVRLRIGGKACGYSGNTLDLEVEVVKTLGESPLGLAAVVRADGVEIILISERTSAYDYHHFENAGIDPRARKVLVVKSANQFYAGFEEIAAEVLYAGAPGLTGNLKQFEFTRIDRPK
jgi:microcystin degradation protein MlrC